MPRKVDGCHIHIPKHGALSAVDTRVTNFPAGGGVTNRVIRIGAGNSVLFLMQVSSILRRRQP